MRDFYPLDPPSQRYTGLVGAVDLADYRSTPKYWCKATDRRWRSRVHSCRGCSKVHSHRLQNAIGISNSNCWLDWLPLFWRLCHIQGRLRFVCFIVMRHVFMWQRMWKWSVLDEENLSYTVLFSQLRKVGLQWSCHGWLVLWLIVLSNAFGILWGLFTLFWSAKRFCELIQVADWYKCQQARLTQ